MGLLKIVYVANIVIIGFVSITFLFFPKRAHVLLIEKAYDYSEAYRMLGTLYFALFLLSIVGLFYPLKMSLILLFQLLYKGAWILFVALPAKLKEKDVPRVALGIFLVYIAVLPFVIPWSFLFG